MSERSDELRLEAKAQTQAALRSVNTLLIDHAEEFSVEYQEALQRAHSNLLLVRKQL